MWSRLRLQRKQLLLELESRFGSVRLWLISTLWDVFESAVRVGGVLCRMVRVGCVRPHGACGAQRLHTRSDILWGVMALPYSMFKFFWGAWN